MFRTPHLLIFANTLPFLCSYPPGSKKRGILPTNKLAAKPTNYSIVIRSNPGFQVQFSSKCLFGCGLWQIARAFHSPAPEFELVAAKLPARRRLMCFIGLPPLIADEHLPRSILWDQRGVTKLTSTRLLARPRHSPRLKRKRAYARIAWAAGGPFQFRFVLSSYSKSRYSKKPLSNKRSCTFSAIKRLSMLSDRRPSFRMGFSSSSRWYQPS